ncbi:hypothetical protein BGZ94_010092 [Podila epigama]|nr:hypothetical protein BGZ94_010092 [Podila epigama]
MADSTTIYITNHNYRQSRPLERTSDKSASNNVQNERNRYTLYISPSDESLSDMIFKSSNIGQTHFASMAAGAVMATSSASSPPFTSPLEEHHSNSEDEPLTRSNRMAAGDTGSSMNEGQNLARIRATETKASLTLSSDSSSGISALSNASSSSETEEREETSIKTNKMGSQEGIIAGLALVHSPEAGQSVFATEKEAAHQNLQQKHTESSLDSTSDPVLKQFSYQSTEAREKMLSELDQNSSFHQGTPFSGTRLGNAEQGEKGDEEIYPQYNMDQGNNSDLSNDAQPNMQPNSSDSSPSLSSLSERSSRYKNSGHDDNSVSNSNSNSNSFTQRKHVAMVSTVEPSPESSKSSLSKVATSTSALPSTPTTSVPPPMTCTTPTRDVASESATASIPPQGSASTIVPSPVPYTAPPVAPLNFTTSSTAANVFASTTPTSPKTKSSLASLPLRFWRERSNNTSTSEGISIDAMPTPVASFTQTYLGNTFSKKKKLQIPTIVIHPDEEDGEAPRVLSQSDIEYLTTMPPPPLRLLVQPWDEEEEMEEMEDERDIQPTHVLSQAYDYDDLDRAKYHRERSMDGIMEEDEEEGDGDGSLDYEDDDGGDADNDDDEDDGLLDHHVYTIPSYDPYALDVPIDLQFDLQNLGHNNLKNKSTTQTS